MTAAHSKVLVGSFLTALGLGMFSATSAQTVDLSGLWDLTSDITLTNENVPCLFVGTANVIQIRDQISGNAMLGLVSGPGTCPAEMDAKLTGTVVQGTVQMGVLLGALGEATFTGNPIGKGIVNNSLTGGFSVTVGQFAGASGPWGAVVTPLIFKDGFESLAKWSPLTAGTLFFGLALFMSRRSQVF